MNMTTTQTAKFIGLPETILINMRTMSTRGNDRRGPPFCRVMDKEGVLKYTYSQTEVIKWMSQSSIQLTANDAAYLLGISRTQVLALYGLQKHKVGNGELVIDSAKNFFIFIRKRKLKLKAGKK